VDAGGCSDGALVAGVGDDDAGLDVTSGVDAGAAQAASRATKATDERGWKRDTTGSVLRRTATNVARAIRRMPGRARDPNPAIQRQGSMATPELISLIVAVIAWIVLLGAIAPDP
jgi:hypothetical protein